MKKNMMMRTASVLLVAVMLTMSIVSGTYAKYVTTGELSGQARVAKFGVVITGSGSLFAQNYWGVNEFFGNKPSDHTNYPNPDLGNETVLTVESSNGNKIVAPGTNNGSGLKLALTGAPEVDVKITLSIADGFEDIFLAKGTYPNMITGSDSEDTFNVVADYHPVLFTLKTGDGTVIVEKSTLADMQAALNGYTIYVDANTDLSNPKYSYTLSWEWAFEGPYEYPEVVVFGKETVDKMDTLLGELAAGTDLEVEEDDYSTDISVSLSVTVSQVD